MKRLGGGGGYGGDRGGGDRGSSGDMVTQEDTIFIQGMVPDTTESELCEYFGAIGTIKVINHNYPCTSFFSTGMG